MSNSRIPEVLDVLATQDSFVVVGGTTGKEFAAVTVDAKSGNIERRFTSPAPFFDVSRYSFFFANHEVNERLGALSHPP